MKDYLVKVQSLSGDVISGIDSIESMDTAELEALRLKLGALVQHLHHAGNVLRPLRSDIHSRVEANLKADKERRKLAKSNL